MSVSLPTNDLKNHWCQCGKLKAFDKNKCSDCQKIALPTNKEEKRQRLIMLVKQDSITVKQGNKLYRDYCRLYDRVKK